MHYEEEMSVIKLNSLGADCKRAFKVPNAEKGN